MPIHVLSNQLFGYYYTMQYVSRYISTILPFVLCVVHYRNLFLKLDSMRWFSHRRRTGGRHNWRPREPLLTKCSTFSFFLSLTTLTFDHEIRTRRDFCTVHLTANFHPPTFNRSEVIVLTNKLTNKQTPLKTSTSLRYATPMGIKVPVVHVAYNTNG